MPSPLSHDDTYPACVLVDIAKDFTNADASIRNTRVRVDTQSGLWQLIQHLEQAAAIVLGILSFPVVAIAATVIALLSKRTPFIAHRRVGISGKEIWIYKIRTMWDESCPSRSFLSCLEYLDNTHVPEIKVADDPRVKSRFAALCRRFSIDELPQLWQVARGTLALIGPRPITAFELQKFYGPAAHSILQVKPGITGLWQVRGRDRLTYNQRRRLDLYMVSNWSVRLYLRILFASVPSVLLGRDAS